MDDSGERERSSSSSGSVNTNCKLASDSGYGSNKSNSNSQSQRSSGSGSSSKSSGSSNGYPPHPNAQTQISDYQAERRSSNDNNKNEQRTSPEGLSAKDQKVQNLLETNITNNNNGTTTNSVAIAMPNYSGAGTLSQLPPAVGNIDSKTLQMAAITHALCCIKKFQQDPYSEYLKDNFSKDSAALTCDKWQQYFSEECVTDETWKDDGFGTVVSMDDGVVVYITPNVTGVLGFPKDMLIGRNFIDFMHPKDRIAFANHITCGMSLPLADGNGSQNYSSSQGLEHNVPPKQFFCRLRQYRGLKSIGFGVADKTVVYYPFQLTMKMKTAETENHLGKENLSTTKAKSFKNANPVHLIMTASRIKSAYQYPEEVPTNPGRFMTRHSASCHFGHMDTEAISYLGHLPQDLIGNSVLDYYHPDDLCILKDIYKGIMHEQGKPFRSRPYRFRAFNGSFAMLETDWSCFINPWSWKLEFVIGQHRVIQGPGNPNVFMSPDDEILKSEVVNDMGKETQEDIRRLLAQSVTQRFSHPMKLPTAGRRKDLAASMETLLEPMGKTENSENSGSQCSGMFSAMERDSVMLGEMSPHHDDCSGSNESSEVPPSYSQLNYKENIERFFQSQPKTSRSEESGDSKSKMENTQSSSPKCSEEQLGDDQNSKSLPNENDSSASNRLCGKTMGSNESDDRETFDTCSMILTEDVLSRHNEDMEKNMIQKHRELRGKQKSCAASQKECRHKISEKLRRRKQSKDCDADVGANNDGVHGVKRTGNSGWEGEDHQCAFKYPHLDENAEKVQQPQPTAGHRTGINLWPPFSISMTPGYTTPTYRPTSAGEVLRPNSGMGVPGYHFYQPQIHPVSNDMQEQSAEAPIMEAFMNISNNMNSIPNRPSLMFVPGQQNFLPQHVQYAIPAGVVFQPINPQVLGQSQPILMTNIIAPAVIHPLTSLDLTVSGQTQSVTKSSINLPTMTTSNVVAGKSSTASPVQIHSIQPSSAIVTTTTTAAVTASLKFPNCAIAARTSPSRYNVLNRNIPVVPGNLNIKIKPQQVLKTDKNCNVENLTEGTDNTPTRGPISLKQQQQANQQQHQKSQSSQRHLPHRFVRNHYYYAPSSGLQSSSDSYEKKYSAGGSSSSSYDNSGSRNYSDYSMNSSSKYLREDGVYVSDYSSSSKYLREDAVYVSQCQSDGEGDQEMMWAKHEGRTIEMRRKPKRFRTKVPPWMENVNMTEDVVYRYTVPQRDLSEILQNDLKSLQLVGNQSAVLNDQLDLLYREMDTQQGITGVLVNLEEEESSESCSSTEEQKNENNKPKDEKVKKNGKKLTESQYSKMVVFHEENAPFP